LHVDKTPEAIACGQREGRDEEGHGWKVARPTACEGRTWRKKNPKRGAGEGTANS
jgi:hypothetical protein